MLVLVAAVPIVGVVVLSAREQRRLLVEHASHEATALAQIVAEHHQGYVDAARGLLLGMSQMQPIVALDGAACSAKLAPLLGKGPDYVDIGAISAGGQVFCSASAAQLPLDASDQRFFVEALRTGEMGLGVHAPLGRETGAAMGFGYPVQGADGRVVAVAFAALDVSEMQRALERLPLPRGVEVAVLDRNGVALSALPSSWVGKRFAEDLVVAVESTDEPSTHAGTDGTERLYAHHDVGTREGVVAMHVIVGIPTAAILGPANAVANRALAAALGASGLALAAALVVAELTLVRRLRLAAATSRRIAAGDLSARTGLPPRRDELGELVSSIDEMAQALEELDDEKRRNEEQLRQAQKMEVVGQLAGGVAHDFNNLLTVIMSAASAIRDQVPPGHTSHEDAREVLHAGERAASLTRQLLAFSRRQPLAPRVLDLGAAARSMERLLERVLGEAIFLSVNVRRPAVVFADPGQVELSLLNLTVNARDAMPGGGRLDVEVDVLGEGDPRRPAGADVPAGPLATLTVRDTGVGIPAAIISRIFEPFFTTKAPGHGTGLGLSTVLGIVGQSGGAIRVRTEESSGSEFSVYLPVHEGRPDDPLEASGASPLGRGETILVVEDDDPLRAILQRTLLEHGYRVVDAGTVSGALAAAEREDDLALVLTDVILPEGNGVQVVRELSRRWPGVRAIFMSGHAGEHVSGFHALLPSARFLPKPFTPDVLLKAVREAIDARLAERVAGEV